MLVTTKHTSNPIPIHVYTYDTGPLFTNYEDLPIKVRSQAQHQRIVLDVPYAIIIVARWTECKLLKLGRTLDSIKFFRVPKHKFDDRYINIMKMLDCASRILLPDRYRKAMCYAQPPLVERITASNQRPKNKKMNATIRTCDCKSPGTMTIQFRGEEHYSKGGMNGKTWFPHYVDTHPVAGWYLLNEVDPHHSKLCTHTL
jgi:RNase P subunit RPR2